MTAQPPGPFNLATTYLRLRNDASIEPLPEPGAYVLVPRGTWHTAKTSTRCRMLFVTAGEGTEHRPA